MQTIDLDSLASLSFSVLRGVTVKMAYQQPPTEVKIVCGERVAPTVYEHYPRTSSRARGAVQIVCGSMLLILTGVVVFRGALGMANGFILPILVGESIMLVVPVHGIRSICQTLSIQIPIYRAKLSISFSHHEYHTIKACSKISHNNKLVFMYILLYSLTGRRVKLIFDQFCSILACNNACCYAVIFNI